MHSALKDALPRGARNRFAAVEKTVPCAICMRKQAPEALSLLPPGVNRARFLTPDAPPQRHDTTVDVVTRAILPNAAG